MSNHPAKNQNVLTLIKTAGASSRNRLRLTKLDKNSDDGREDHDGDPAEKDEPESS